MSGTLPGVHATELSDAVGAPEVSGVRASEAEVHSPYAAAPGLL